MSVVKENRIEFAGDVRFERCILTGFDNKQLDILPQVTGIHLFEDIYSPFLTAELFILDNIGVFSKLPFRGEEIITLTILDPAGAGLQERSFFVYKLKDRIVKDQNLYYTLSLISVEAVFDLSLKISKFYSGLPSEIAKEVISKEGLNSEKVLITEESKNRIGFIANYWSPIQIMKFLCERSISKIRKSPTYLFYETKAGFRFMSLDFLAEQSSNHRFHFSQKTTGDIKQGLERIRSMYVDESFDYIDRIKKGMFGSRMLLVNPLSKSYSYRSLDFVYSQNKYARLNPKPLNTDNVTRRLNSNFMVRTATTSAIKDMPSENTLEWFQQRKSELATKSAQKIVIEVPGRMNISVGDISDIFVYAEAPTNTASSDRDMNSLLDAVLSGRYMVTAISHKINRKEHLMMVELSKDSFMEGTTQK